MTTKTAKTKSKVKKANIKAAKLTPIVLNKKITALETQIEEAISHLEKTKEKHLRLLAEFDNYKRRTHEEKIKLLRYSGEEIIVGLLTSIDDLNRIIELDDNQDTQSIKHGVELISSKIFKILKDHHIEPFDSIGEEFDPDLHEALMSEEGETDNIILKEFEKGYKYHERVLRHAKVIVSKEK